MPLKPELEEMLKATVKDPNYQQSLRVALEANPDFAANWLRQADYDRKMNAMKAEQGQFQAKHQKNVEWFDKANTEYKDYLQNKSAIETERTELAKSKADLEAKVVDLESRIEGGGYTDAQEKAMAKEINGLKETIVSLQSNINTQFVNEQKLDQILSDRGQGLFNFVTDSFLDTLSIVDRYKTDFGKPLSKADISSLYEFANENKLTSLEEAYQKKYSAEIETLKKEQYHKEWEKDYVTTHNLPTSGGPAPLGPVQQRLSQKTADGLPPDAPMDAVAAAAAASLRSEGKV